MQNGISHSDLTIADYWAVDLSLPDFKDDKGVGLVLINTEKGKHVLIVSTWNQEVPIFQMRNLKMEDLMSML